MLARDDIKTRLAAWNVAWDNHDLEGAWNSFMMMSCLIIGPAARQPFDGLLDLSIRLLLLLGREVHKTINTIPQNLTLLLLLLKTHKKETRFGHFCLVHLRQLKLRKTRERTVERNFQVL